LAGQSRLAIRRFGIRLNIESLLVAQREQISSAALIQRWRGLVMHGHCGQHPHIQADLNKKILIKGNATNL
jgi:hypothetical protein